MEIAPNNLEVCLKLNRFVCSDADNDIVALSDSRVRILSSHELATLTTVTFSDGHVRPLPAPKSPVHHKSPKTSASIAAEQKETDSENQDKNAVFIDSTVEEMPKRKPSKFLRMLNQERKNRWTSDQQSFPVDGTGPADNEHTSRLHKGMHLPPKFDAASLNPLRQDQLVAKQIRDEMFMDILAQQRSQQLLDNLSQVSGMSAKERILRTGHATGIPDNLRQL